ncbi:MAG: ABC transporter ATP-binding protein [Pirellulaceae bacterium]|nr:MAG: ABC transporter ATP-binding protein [Pirellulaceae bacterium]
MDNPSHSSTPAVVVSEVSFRYGERLALDGVSFAIPRQTIFTLLGPNGSGKSTLFRLMATLVGLQQGRIECFGFDVTRDVYQVRRLLGVVFQSPGLDRHLTVWENLWQHAVLYGLGSAEARRRAFLWLERMGVADRVDERVGKLSGGLARRVELAKAMLPEPPLLLLDEPSSGLDPKARSDLWQCFVALKQQGTTVVLTTHFLDEAERADQLAILDQGRLVAHGSASQLRGECEGELITIQTDDPQAVVEAIRRRFPVDPQVVANCVRLEVTDGTRWLASLMESLGDRVKSISLAKPSLEDVFIARTGHAFHEVAG